MSSVSTPANTVVYAVRTIASDIKLAHSVFALPFALLGAFLAGSHAGGEAGIVWARFGGQLGLIVLAMVTARTVAMLANRIIDQQIDARNPRTAGRALPSGRLTRGQMLAALGVSAGMFMVVCIGFGVLYGNWWPTILGAPVLLWISAYGWLKRMTWLCHLYLGSSLAISPLAAALAIDPAALTAQPALWLLSVMVLFWVAGFDVIYALQDIDVDRSEGLHSIPSRFGFSGALRLARHLHGIAGAALIGALMFEPRFGWIFTIGVIATLALLVYEHATVRRWGTTKIAMTFFTLNGMISCILGGLGIVDILIG